MNVTNSAGSCPAILADGASIHRAKPYRPLYHGLTASERAVSLSRGRSKIFCSMADSGRFGWRGATTAPGLFCWKTPFPELLETLQALRGFVAFRTRGEPRDLILRATKSLLIGPLAIHRPTAAGVSGSWYGGFWFFGCASDRKYGRRTTRVRPHL